MGNVSGVANDWEQVEFGGELLEDSAGGAFPVLLLKLISRFEHILTPDSSNTRAWSRTLQLQMMVLYLLLLHQLYM